MQRSDQEPTPSDGTAAGPVDRRRVRRILAVLLFATLPYGLSQTMIVPALPALGRETGAPPTTTAWLLTGFLLTSAIVTVLAGRLADMRDKGRLLVLLLLFYLAGNALCLAIPEIEAQIAGRVLQGAAGGVFPIAFGIAADELEGAQRVRAISLLSLAMGIGAAVGLPLAGLIVDHAGVRSIYLVGLLCLPAVVLAWNLTHDERRVLPPRPLDVPGAALMLAGTGLLLLAVSRAGTLGWGSPVVGGLVAVGFGCLLALVLVERRTDDPFVALHLVRDRTVLGANLAAFSMGLVLFVPFIALPAMMQGTAATGGGLAMTATAAGMVMLPSAVMQLVGTSLATRLGLRVGFRTVLIASTALGAASFLVLTLAHASVPPLLLSNVLLGLALGTGLAAAPNLIVAGVRDDEVGIATGLNGVSRQMGSALGAALLASYVALRTEAGGTSIPPAAYTDFFVVATIAALATVLAVRLVPRPPGSRGTDATLATEAAD